MDAALSPTSFDMRWAIDPATAAGMDTSALRANFLVEKLFEPGEILLSYTHYDRMVVGGAMPVDGGALALTAIKPMGTKGFLDGMVYADGQTHYLQNRDMLYLGMGTQNVEFQAGTDAAPPKFYLLSAPAHYKHANRLLTIKTAKRLDLGTPETCNKRSIFQFIHADAEVRTCQLVAGITTFAPGSVWNTMPAHVHDRRMEAYLYFDLPETARVFHMMGEPQETRHLVVANEQAVISPAWSIHSGVGTASYTFVWAMAGDNIDYTDIDPVPVETLR
jgi:4-deoxy-L-threo-5-hexosulose-uronate ketol-isomerase